MHTSFRSLTGATRPLALAALSIAVVGALVAPANADASAFQLKENSAKSLGRAYAGSATAGGDASVVVNNPAAMTDLKGTYLQADVTAINFSAKFNGSAHDVLGRPISGGNGGDAGTTLPVPAMFFATQVSDRVHVGGGFSVPFGFQTEYDKDWVGRYNGIKSKFQSLDATLSASFDVTDNFSLGASFIAQKTSAELTSAVNFNAVGLSIQQGIGAQTAAGVAQIQAAAAAGQISAAQASAMIQQAVQQGQAAAAGVAAVTPPGVDGYARIKGDDWGYGWQLGGYWKLTANDKLALNYRSKISHRLQGTGNFTTTPGYDLLLANPALAGCDSAVPAHHRHRRLHHACRDQRELLAPGGEVRPGRRRGLYQVGRVQEPGGELRQLAAADVGGVQLAQHRLRLGRRRLLHQRQADPACRRRGGQHARPIWPPAARACPIRPASWLPSASATRPASTSS